MTDIEHAKKYAEESINLAISMYNPKAEIIAETSCLYGLTFKNKQIAKAKEIIKGLLDLLLEEGYKTKFHNEMKEAEQFIKDSEVEK